MIRNSTRALIGAFVPLGAYHVITTALGLAGYLASPATLPTPDRAFTVFFLLFAIDGTLLVCGHLLLRACRRSSRNAYGLTGGIATTVGYAIATWYEIWISAPLAGTRITGAIFPAFVGMIVGFLYAQFAGRDSAPPPNPTASVIAAAKPASYDGPVQVRTSIAAAILAALVPAVFVAAIATTLGSLAFTTLIPIENRPDDAAMHVFQFAFPAQAFLETLFATIIPGVIVVCATHAIARSLGRLRGREYAAIGAAVNCGAALLAVMFVNPGLLFPIAAIIGGMMGAVYRRFAGLEPLSLPEPVIVDDPANLVGADDPARKGHFIHGG